MACGKSSWKYGQTSGDHTSYHMSLFGTGYIQRLFRLHMISIKHIMLLLLGLITLCFIKFQISFCLVEILLFLLCAYSNFANVVVICAQKLHPLFLLDL